MANVIDSLTLGSSTGVFSIPYTVCDTAAATAAKTVSLTNFSLETSAQIRIKFNYANTVSNPTLNVNSTGAKNIYWHGAALDSTQYWAAGAILDFVYNGTQWDLIGIASIDGIDTAKVEEITYAEYQALATKDPNTMYVVTDVTLFDFPVDDTPTSDSTNAVSSGGVYTALEGAMPKKISITLSTSWTEGDNFTQNVTVTGGTANSLVALQPTAAQIVALQEAGVTALMVDNNNGTFTATAVGAAPTEAMTIQATLTEVSA